MLTDVTGMRADKSKLNQVEVFLLDSVSFARASAPGEGRTKSCLLGDTPDDDDDCVFLSVCRTW